MLDLRDNIVDLIDGAAPPLDVHNVANGARRRRRVTRTLIAGGATTALVAATVTIAILPTGTPAHLRVATRDSSTTAATTPSSPTSAPLLYRDRSRPPPLRIETGGRSIDITTVLGCWFAPETRPASHGYCADGRVDPARFVLADSGARQLTIQSPIACHIVVTFAAPPPPHGPHELAAAPVNPRVLPVRSTGNNRWSVELPARTGPIAIYIELKADSQQGREHGDASYGFELRGA